MTPTPSLLHSLSISIDTKPDWRGNSAKFLCFVQHNGFKNHQAIMKSFFQARCGLTDEADFRDLMLSNENCARALLWDYLRRHYIGFEDHNPNYVSSSDLPKRQPDEEGNGYAMWMEKLP